jgi:hypothetical protein
MEQKIELIKELYGEVFVFAPPLTSEAIKRILSQFENIPGWKVSLQPDGICRSITKVGPTPECFFSVYVHGDLPLDKAIVHARNFIKGTSIPEKDFEGMLDSIIDLLRELKSAQERLWNLRLKKFGEEALERARGFFPPVALSLLGARVYLSGHFADIIDKEIKATGRAARNASFKNRMKIRIGEFEIAPGIFYPAFDLWRKPHFTECGAAYQKTIITLLGTPTIWNLRYCSLAVLNHFEFNPVVISEMVFNLRKIRRILNGREQLD